VKPRARRITIGAAALTVVLVAVLVVACWSTVRDHVEAWRFQMTRETWTLHPGVPRCGSTSNLTDILCFELADASGLQVILEFLEETDSPAGLSRLPFIQWKKPRDQPQLVRQLEMHGYRVLKQRFPRRAYVRILAEHEGRNRRTR